MRAEGSEFRWIFVLGGIAYGDDLRLVFCCFDELVERVVEAQGFVDDCEAAFEIWEYVVVLVREVVAG